MRPIITQETQETEETQEMPYLRNCCFNCLNYRPEKHQKLKCKRRLTVSKNDLEYRACMLFEPNYDESRWKR